MKYDSDDALDRALFALPGGAAGEACVPSILTATVYRPVGIRTVGDRRHRRGRRNRHLVCHSHRDGWRGTLFAHTLDTIGQLHPRVLQHGHLAWTGAGIATAVCG